MKNKNQTLVITE